MATFDPTTADKDQLVKFAKDEYQVTIDPRTKIETIRARVEGLISGVTPIEEAAVASAIPAAPSIAYVKSSLQLFNFCFF